MFTCLGRTPGTGAVLFTYLGKSLDLRITVGIAMDMPEPSGYTHSQIRLIFHFMEEMGLDNFCLTGMDRQGERLSVFRTTSAGGDAALRSFMRDWVREQEWMNDAPER